MPMVGSGWWREFNSPELNGIITDVVAQNPDLASAALRVLQSELELGNIRAQGVPSVSAGASATSTSSTDFFGDRDTNTSGDLTASVRWEADLWGRIAREGDSGEARLLATSYDRDALANSLIASVVKTYVGIAFDRRAITSTERIIESRSVSLAITEERFGRGIDGTSAGNVKSAEENLAAAQAELPEIQLTIARGANAIDTLVARVPTSRSDIQGRLPTQLPQVSFSTGTPVELLERRPDIRAAAARLTAANANIDVSLADRFPTLTLTGNLFSSGEDLDQILDIDSVIASLTADLLVTVFDGGRGIRLVSIRRAEAEELANTYVSTVLAAIGEVEDALAGERFLAERSRLLDIRLDAAREATTIAQERYLDGTGDYLTLLDASRSEASAESAFLGVERNRWLNRTDLILALGGTWAPARPSEDAAS